jgi:Arginine degradation protein (predicted deacylase)
MSHGGESLQERIKEILYGYVGVRSDTNSACEKSVDDFFRAWFAQVPYFKDHPELCGLYPIPDDDIGRSVPWALRKGSGDETIVMIHHCDCVETSDYSGLEKVCLKPDALAKAFKDDGEELPPDIEADLDSGEWLFGRGVADMKGGGSIELALMEKYCREADFKGNIIVMALPDEENLSAGMRGACYLLHDLQKKHGLKYVLMLNTEPHERTTPAAPLLYDGSVGKIMPVIYVRGKVAHVGQVYTGLNPINLLAEIVRRTELNPAFIEKSGNTVSPPSTWLYSKDRKTVYDVSLPMDAVGYMSILPLEKTPKAIMDEVKEICAESFVSVLKDMNASYEIYLKANALPVEKLPFRTNVKFFAELYEEALRDSGQQFVDYYTQVYAKVKEQWIKKELAIIDGVNQLIAATLKHVKDPWPMVVIALSPPYYPSVNNMHLTGAVTEKAAAAIGEIRKYAKDEFKQDYGVKNYYTGISDLSYAMFSSDESNIDYIKNNMLLWGTIYSIPLELIRELSMPVVNIGPWGKDFHKYTERVLKDDVYRVTPALVDKMVRTVLGS